jgi:hypothetical protein
MMFSYRVTCYTKAIDGTRITELGRADSVKSQSRLWIVPDKRHVCYEPSLIRAAITGEMA